MICCSILMHCWMFAAQGATANEDRLQENVPQTIALLSDAGIRVCYRVSHSVETVCFSRWCLMLCCQIWMLTGDKSETAVNIAFATQMLSSEMELFMCTTDALGSNNSSQVLTMLASKAAVLRNDAASHRGDSRCGVLACFM